MPEEKNNRIHLSNTVTNLIPDKRQIHYMYEDSDIEGSEDTEAYFIWLDKHAPGQFILIDTGDYIHPLCSTPINPADIHFYCETYDAHYRLYLVPVSVWEQCKDEVLKADHEWRERVNQCQSVA